MKKSSSYAALEAKIEKLSKTYANMKKEGVLGLFNGREAKKFLKLAKVQFKKLPQDYEVGYYTTANVYARFAELNLAL